MDIYTVKSTDVIYPTSVDFVVRPCNADVHLVQYDSSQPVLAVELYKDGKKFTLPSSCEANIRFAKHNGSAVRKAALGCNADRTIIYLAIDAQMTLYPGRADPIVELTYDGSTVGSSPLRMVIDRNPVENI